MRQRRQWGVVQAHDDVKLRVHIVLEETQSGVFPPVHHLVEELDVVFYRTKGEGDFLPHSVPDLTEHSSDVNPEHLQVGEFTLRQSHSCLVDLVSCGKERIGVKRRVLFGKLAVKPKRNGDVLEEGSFSDGQTQRVVDLILSEPCTSGCQRDSALPYGVDEVQVGLGKGPDSMMSAASSFHAPPDCLRC